MFCDFRVLCTEIYLKLIYHQKARPFKKKARNSRNRRSDLGFSLGFSLHKFETSEQTNLKFQKIPQTIF